MPNIKSLVFEEVFLRDTDKHLQQLDSLNFSSIGPFVSKVSFLPSPYTTKLSFDLCEYFCRVGIGSGDRTIDVESWSENLKKAYSEYLTRARVVESRVHTRKLQRIWVPALRSFCNAHTFSFLPLDVSSLHSVLPPGTLAGPKMSSSEAPAGFRHGVAIPCEDQLIKNATDCLAKAASKVQNLEFESGMLMGIDDTATRAAWRSVDLTKLQCFHYLESNVSFLGINGNRTSAAHSMASAINRNVEGILQYAHKSLEEIFFEAPYYDEISLRWSAMSALGFPQLRILTLSWIQFPARSFAEAIAGFGALEELGFYQCEPLEVWNMAPEGPGTWKMIFDALRNHANVLEFSCISYNEPYGYDLSFGCRTDGSIPDRLDREDHALNADVCRYISKRIAWNDLLESTFPQL